MNTEIISTVEESRELIRQKLKVDFDIKLHERSKIMKMIDEYAKNKTIEMLDAYITEMRGEIVYTQEANEWKAKYLSENFPAN